MHEFLCRLGHIQTLVNSVVCRSHRQQKPGLKLQTRREMHAGRSFSSLPARAAGQRRSSASWEKKNKPCGRRTNKRRLKETQSSDDLVSESEKLSGVFFEERLFLAAFMVPKWQSSTLQLYMKPLRSSRTYRVNSSMSCVWSGGKNFTTKRRMVFLGPADRQEKGGGAKGKTEGCGKVSVPLNQTHRRKRKENSDKRSEGSHSRRICLSVGFRRSSQTWGKSRSGSHRSAFIYVCRIWASGPYGSSWRPKENRH